MPAPTRIATAETGESALPKDDVELRLEKALFGDDAGFLESLKRRDPEDLTRQDSDEELEDAGDDLFFLDTGASTLPPSITETLQQPHPSHREPVWHDSDDDRLTVSLASHTRLRKLRGTEDDDVVSGREYILRLRRQYERLHPTPEWVTYARKRRKLTEDSDSDGSTDEDELPTAKPLAELLRTDGSLARVSTGTGKLRPEVIDVRRCKDIAGPGPSSVDALEFHPFYPLLLAAGPSSSVTLYHVSPQPPNPNPILTSLHLKGTPLHTAAFCHKSEDETRIFLSSRRRYFHAWSLSTGVVAKVTRAMYGEARKEQRTMEAFKISPCGRYIGLIGSSKKGGGSVNVLSTESMQWICSCRIDSRGGVADFAWWRNGNGLSVVGKNGEVSEYDITAKSVVMRWTDDGAVGTTVISLGGDADCLGRSRWVAIGSSSGIVNLYDRRTLEEKPKPARMFDQLTTPISHLEFSQDGQLLVMSSRWKKNALRLIQLPSCTLYRNWPTDNTPLGRVSSVALSPVGGYLAVGNEQGKIRLWEIQP